MELLRIELESKKLQIESIKHELQAQIDELEDRAQNAERTSRVYQTKLAHLSVDQDQRKQRSQNDMQRIIQRQTELEATNRKLSAETAMIEEGLADLTVDDEEYAAIAILPIRERTIQQTAKGGIRKISQNFFLKIIMTRFF